VWFDAIEELWDCYISRPTTTQSDKVPNVTDPGSKDEKAGVGTAVGLQIPTRLARASLEEWAGRRLGAISNQTDPPARSLELTWSLAREIGSQAKPDRDLQSISVSIQGDSLDKLLKQYQADRTGPFLDVISRRFSEQTGIALNRYPLMRLGLADGNVFLGCLEGRVKLLPDLPDSADQCDLKRWIVEELTRYSEEVLLR